MMMCAILLTASLSAKSVPHANHQRWRRRRRHWEVDDKEMPDLSDVRETVVLLLRTRPVTTAVTEQTRCEEGYRVR
jgi:hypothetical protein